MSGQMRSCILIVDDRPEITEMLSDLLSSQYDCETVASGEEALKRLRAREFHLLICDITMPGMSGLETLPKAKCISPNCVVKRESYPLQYLCFVIKNIGEGAFPVWRFESVDVNFHVIGG